MLQREVKDASSSRSFKCASSISNYLWIQVGLKVASRKLPRNFKIASERYDKLGEWLVDILGLGGSLLYILCDWL